MRTQWAVQWDIHLYWRKSARHSSGPALPGLGPQRVVDTSHSEAADIYELASSTKHLEEHIWPGQEEAPGCCLCTSFFLLWIIGRRRQEKGMLWIAFWTFFFKWGFLLWCFQLSQLKWWYSQHLHPTAKEVLRFLSWLDNDLAGTGSIACPLCLRQPFVPLAHSFLPARGTRD